MLSKRLFSFVLKYSIMSRQKGYKEEEVVEKAMNLFWRNGYEATSMAMLEQEMGINKFSIYSSFGSKSGLFLESLKCYKQKINLLIEKLESSNNGTVSIKKYFYDFLEFSREDNFRKGCLVTNTANELSKNDKVEIQEALSNFTNSVKEIFATTLGSDIRKNKKMIEEEADYLLVSMFGLSSASRVFSERQLSNYIENIFKNL